jgi:NADH-quinone oxidoreductase subunit I
MAVTKITIDYDRCQTPYDCKKCLQICPQAVFRTVNLKMEKWKESDQKKPGTFRLEVAYGDKCVVCDQCIEVCPVDALRITCE